MYLIIIILVAFAIYGLSVSHRNSIVEQEKLKLMSIKEKDEYYRKQKEAQDKANYNGLKYTCTICRSQKIKMLTKISRGTSVALFGGSSDKFGKLYECYDCKHKW